MKLSNGVEYQNIHFNEALGEYLISNGFNCTAVKNDLHFIKENKQLIVRNDNIDFFRFQPEKELQEDQWVFDQNHSGIGNMDLFKWMLLVHAMDIISIQQFLKNARATDKQHYVEAMLLVKSVLLTGTSSVAF